MEILKKNFLFTGTALILFLVSTTVPRMTFGNDALLGSWHPEDESAQEIEDQSGNDYTAVVKGKPAIVEGDYGYAVEFNGRASDRQYIDCGVTQINEITGPLTVEMWLCPNNLDTRQTILSTHEFKKCGFEIRQEKEMLIFLYSKNEVQYGGAEALLTSKGRWIHYVISFNKGMTIAYVDGRKVNSADTKNPELEPSPHNLIIGAAAPSGSYGNFEGLISTWKIYNKELNEKEIAAAYEKSRVGYKKPQLALKSSAVSVSKSAPAAEPLLLFNEENQITMWAGLKPETNSEFIKDGIISGMWEGANAGKPLSSDKLPSDWSGYGTLQFWMYSVVNNNATIILQIQSPGENGAGDYYHQRFSINWQGWRLIKFPLQKMAISRSPAGWNKIALVAFHSVWGGVEAKKDTGLYIDRMTLEPKTAPPPSDKRTISATGLPGWKVPLKFKSWEWEKMFSASVKNASMKEILDNLTLSVKNNIPAKPDTRPRNEIEAKGLFSETQRGSTGIKGEQFALAMADCTLANKVFTTYVSMAIVYRYTRDEEIKLCLLRQLEEIADNWQPLQRPGWTLYTPGSDLPQNWKGDGVWLATGWGLVGIVEILNAMGDSVPPALLVKIKKLLRSEIALVMETWEKELAWYVVAKQFNSNQWIFPLMGMVYACLYLEDESLRSAYELGMDGIAKSCLAQGNDGSYTEGAAYATMTMDVLAPTLLFIQWCGDRRLSELPFVKKFSTYYSQLQMPGRRIVNAYDGSGFSGENSTASSGYTLSILLSGDLSSHWVMDNIFQKTPRNFGGFLYQFFSQGIDHARLTPPELFAFFTGSQLFVWRSSWDMFQAVAFWMRGNSMNDTHSHRDQGHISLYNGETPVLVEAANPPYGTEGAVENFIGVKGHNVLQSGGVLAHTVPCLAPITVESAGENGGTISIDGGYCYTDVEKWQRTLNWQKNGPFIIKDSVIMSEGGDKKTGEEWFRFHTGTSEVIDISSKNNKTWIAKWPAAEIIFTADQPIDVVKQIWPNSAFRRVQCLTIKAAANGNKLELKTEIILAKIKKETVNEKKMAVIDYAKYLVENPLCKSASAKPIIIEAENMLSNGSSGIKISDKKIGAVVSTTGWNAYGTVMEAAFETEESSYIIALKYCTASMAKRNFYFDAKQPFREAAGQVFLSTQGALPSDGFANKTDDWKVQLLGNEKGPFIIHFKKGKHTITIENEEGPLNLDFIIIAPAGFDISKLGK